MTSNVIGNDNATGDIIIPRKSNWETPDYIVIKIQERSFRNSNGIHSFVFTNDSNSKSNFMINFFSSVPLSL